MILYKKEWEAFLIEYFENEEYVKVDRLWFDIISDPNSKIFNIYEETIKTTSGTFSLNRSVEIRKLENVYNIVDVDLFGYVRLNERVKRKGKINKLKDEKI